MAFVGLMLYGRKNPGLFVDFALSRIENSYGPDVTEQDKKELRAAVAEFKEAIRANRVREGRNGGWQGSFSFRGSRSDKVSHDDVQQLIRAFRESIIPAAPSAAPAAPPATVPTPS